MRDIPGFSLAYLGRTAGGNTAGPAAAGEALDEGLSGLAAVALAAGATTGCAVASDPHCVLRKSFHFTPPSVPAVCASLYLALHSLAVSARAGALAKPSPRPRTTALKVIRTNILLLQNWRGAQHRAHLSRKSKAFTPMSPLEYPARTGLTDVEPTTSLNDPASRSKLYTAIGRRLSPEKK